jgi:hypothetical protein
MPVRLSWSQWRPSAHAPDAASHLAGTVRFRRAGQRDSSDAGCSLAALDSPNGNSMDHNPRRCRSDLGSYPLAVAPYLRRTVRMSPTIQGRQRSLGLHTWRMRANSGWCIELSSCTRSNIPMCSSARASGEPAPGSRGRGSRKTWSYRRADGHQLRPSASHTSKYSSSTTCRCRSFPPRRSLLADRMCCRLYRSEYTSACRPALSGWPCPGSVHSRRRGLLFNMLSN